FGVLMEASLSAEEITGTQNVEGLVIRVSLADLGVHKLSTNFAASTYGAALGFLTSLKVIGSDVYVLGLVSVDAKTQSIARLKGADGSLDSGFAPVLSYNYFGLLTLNGVISDLVETPNGDILVGGLFTVNYEGEDINYSTVLDSKTGAVKGPST